ncbi:hypothetical protein CANINC_001659 [Pichia inconspicua]|uniref:Uncharacterized protein n=1 Tax=Pichia inconspicua TaxID=52247 RepID=A0A4T0X334_9ASCO|nr:hypothetical protein CANINC_001659 [[Candida] inconspicua]
MPVAKNITPSSHPAENLSNAVPEDIKNQLLKTPKYLSIEYDRYNNTLNSLRNDFKYCYIIEWLYLMKHLIKLYDAFDVENFEEELLGIAPPTFMNNLKSKLVQYLKNEKMQNIDMEFDFFVDQIYQDYELIEQEEDYNDPQNNNEDNSLLITYTKLPILEQIDVLYNLIKLCNTKSFTAFRNNVDKYQNPHSDLKVIPIYEIVDEDFKIEYIILQDARLYLRKWKFNQLEIPLTREEFDEKFKDPYTDLASLDPEMIQWECLTHNIYQYDAYITNLKKSFGKKYSSHEYKLSKVLEENIDFIIQHDLKKRKQSAQRKREIEMQMLMANRKRSSRLEEKEKRKREEDEARMKQLESMKHQAAELRASKRQKLKDDMFNSNDRELSREERMKKRQGLAQQNSNETEITNSYYNGGINYINENQSDHIQENNTNLLDDQISKNEESDQHDHLSINSESLPSLISNEQTLESQDNLPATANDENNTSQDQTQPQNLDPPVEIIY